MVGLSAHGESADLPLDNMLAVTFRQQAGQYVVLRLRGRNDAMLQLWHDGLQAVLAAYLASRRFTTEAHADWLRPAHPSPSPSPSPSPNPNPNANPSPSPNPDQVGGGRG